MSKKVITQKGYEDFEVPEKGIARYQIAKAINSDKNTILSENENTLEISRGGRSLDTVFPRLVVVREGGAYVLLIINDKCATLNTTQAHEIGRDIILLAAQSTADELVQVAINGERFSLTLDQARNLAKGLIRKADAADDFQIQHNVRLIR